MTRARRRTALALWVAGLAASGCAYETRTLDIPAPDALAFEQTVYPLLLSDCGFPACHGTHERPFSVFGPGRTRLEPELAPYDPATTRELALTYARARSMLISPDGVRRAPLLRKPLAVAAGGSGHLGDDAWGKSVFPSKREPRYETLFVWAVASQTKTETP